MNNLDTLWAYIKKHAPPEGIEDGDGGPGKFRDLKQYHDKKISRWKDVGRTEERRAIELVDDPLDVCNLRRDGNELSTGDRSHEVPVVAMLLAMSIVLNLDESTLRKAKTILERRDVRDIEMRMKSLLSKGDVVQSIRFPKLELKNFKSVSLGFEQVEANYSAAAEDAYEGAMEMLTKMRQQLLQGSSGIPTQFKGKFSDYFGNPDAMVDVEKLGFQGGAELGLADRQTRSTVVRAVLNCVWKGIESRDVRFYFGGGSIIPFVEAYVPNIKSTHRNGRINVHLAIGFFGNDQRVIKDGIRVSRGGVLVHELSHALAGTIDVGQAYKPNLCKTLTDESWWGTNALVNAQSYASFVEDAFG